MPRVEFIGAPHLDVYNGEVSFASGDIKDVTIEQATYLLQTFGDLGLFKKIDDFEMLASSEDGSEPEPVVNIEFLANKYLEAYNGSDVEFEEAGEIKAVPVSVAEKLLVDHADKFRIVEDSVVLHEVSDDDIEVMEAARLELPDKVINLLKENKTLTMVEMVDKLFLDSHQVLIRPVKDLVDNGLLIKNNDDDKPTYSLANADEE